jgi:protein SCO1/2
VVVQRALSPALRARTHFVSITLDPLRDHPADLEAYARARGADLSDWSFLTGPPDEVESVVKAWGAGGTRSPDGQIEHVVVTFLVDGHGRIVKRYVGGGHAPQEIVADMQAVAFPSVPRKG